MPVITVSSQYGGGARDVSRLLSRQLGLEYVDQAVLVDASRELGRTVSEVAERDERTDSLRTRLGNFLQRALERSAAGGAIDPMLGAGNLELMLSQSYQELSDGGSGVVDDRSVLATTSDIITSVAQRGHVVIMGRGSQMILREMPGVTHVQLVAEPEIAISRVSSWESLDRETAVRRIEEFNKGRADFHKKFWNVDVWSPLLYDLVINTTNLSYAQATDLIAAAAEAKDAAVARG